MDSAKKSWWQSRRLCARRLIQLYSALLYNAHLKGFVQGDIYRGNAKALCVPGLNCYSCPGAVGACPLGALQNALAASGHRAGWYVLGILLLYGLLLGRTVCGWLCPFGLFQELLHKIPTPKVRKSSITRALTWLKYGVLGVFVVLLPLWYALGQGVAVPAFCKYICPAGTLEGAFGLLPTNDALYPLLGGLFTQKVIILLAIALACVFCYRAFCRFLCPLGVLYGLFNRFCLVGVRVDASRCTHCGACVRTCKMDVRRVGDRECIHCGHCAGVCATQAISMQAGRITLAGPQYSPGAAAAAQKKRTFPVRLLQAAALAVLVFALVWFNVLDPGGSSGSEITPLPTPAPEVEVLSPAVTWASSAPLGSEVGQQLQDFCVTCYDGTLFHLAAHRGQVVFINLWATWCGPCVQELPYFNALCAAHPGEVAVLAVSSPLYQTEDPVAFLEGRGLTFSFADDTPQETVYRAVNGSATLPQTVVLNRRGEVVYNQQGSVSPELLEALLQKAAAPAAALQENNVNNE